MQQSDPSAIQATLDGILADTTIKTLRDFIADLPSSNPAVPLYIRSLLFWRAVRRESPSWLALLTCWPESRALMNLARLHLFDCNLGPASVAVLAPFLQRAPALRELNLDHNSELADPKAYAVLVPALSQLRTLTKLSLTYCQLPEGASTTLGALIEGAVGLEELDLEGNRLQDGGARHLAEAIIRSQPDARLRLLNLSDNGLQGAVPVQLALRTAAQTRHVCIAVHDVFRFDMVARPTPDT